MKPFRTLHNIEQLKLLGDPRRLAILQWLMAGPESLTTLGKRLGDHPAKVRHHLKLLEEQGFVELVSTRIVRGFVEKTYQATSRAFVFTGLILPQNPEPCKDTILALGSHDLALERLTSRFNQDHGDEIHFISLPVGSLEGLVALRQGMCQMAGCHLLDADSGEYNLPYVRHLFPERPMVLITLAYRQQGLILPAGNPQRLRGLGDLTREDVQFINRAAGSGTRIWLDQQLHQLHIPAHSIRGYEQEAFTHTQVAAAIAQGKATSGIGLEASARQFNLGYIPLFQECYDLVIPQENMQVPGVTRVVDNFLSGEYRREFEGLGGYDTTQSGKEKRNIG
jgi:molybdate-binding protein/DNA-binding transcriptional ArsR family regulator